MKLLAHITTYKEKRKEQSLKEHSYKTAKYASECLLNTKFSNTAYLAGLLHDIGKATKLYNEYLEKAFRGEKVQRGSVNHTFAGVIYLFEKFHTDVNSPMEKLTCEITATAIGSHHGLFDCVDLDGNNGFLHRLRKDRSSLCYDEAVSSFFEQVADESEVQMYFQKAVKEITDFFEEAGITYNNNGYKTFFQISMLSRLILSSVIEGDRRNTAEFMSQWKEDEREDINWDKWLAYCEDQLSKLDTSSTLNRIRHDISGQCLAFAGNPPDIYRLNVPTGGGKTLSLLRYALAHAQEFNKKRIIYSIPLLSVLDQNVRVIRDYVPDKEKVLEHHSNVVHEKDKGEELDPYELLKESWGAPVIVSTLVQLLDILFKHQTSAIRRMQALCDSVVVIDEVQSLPVKVTEMFNMAMNFLKQYCNATIILSSATQPCFEELKWPIHLAKEPDMVHLDSLQLRTFIRAQVIDCTSPYGMDLDECTEFCGNLVKKHSSVLIVCNTKSQARKLFRRLQKEAKQLGGYILHLSTSMCQEHRSNDLKELQNKLSLLQDDVRNGGGQQKVICVSTQVIEAGMDISFEAVVRVLAGIDNLVQVIGRCNRSNEYGNIGKVYLIHLKNENLGMLQDIKYRQICTRKVLEFRKQIGETSSISGQAVHRYYQYLFEEIRGKVRYPVKSYGTEIYLMDLLSNNNGSANGKENAGYLLHQPFKTAGQIFEVFDKDTIDVLVPYQQGKKLIEQLKSMEEKQFHLENFKEIMQKAKKYTVSIFENEKERLGRQGVLHGILENRIFVLDDKAYHGSYGLMDMEEYGE